MWLLTRSNLKLQRRIASFAFASDNHNCRSQWKSFVFWRLVLQVGIIWTIKKCALIWPGYIGGSILDRLLTHHKNSTFEITTLVRSQDKARTLTKFGVTPVVGSLSDLLLLEGLAADADVVFDAVCWSYSELLVSSERYRPIQTIWNLLRQSCVDWGGDTKPPVKNLSSYTQCAFLFPSAS